MSVAARLAVSAIVLISSGSAFATDYAAPGPFAADVRRDVSIRLGGRSLRVDLYAPTGAPLGAAVVGAHGLNGNKGELAGLGEHLATHGFAVAIPTFHDSSSNAVPDNAGRVVELLAWMEADATFFADRVEAGARGVFGHSMGGLVTYLAASEDPLVAIAVGLDPVDDPAGSARAAVPSMAGDAVMLRAAGVTICNGYAAFQDALYDAFPNGRLSFRVTSANHCDPSDPPSAGCAIACLAQVDRTRHLLFRKYLTAALRFHLACDAEARTWLDGPGLQADSDAARINSVESDRTPAQPGRCPAPVPDAGVEAPGDAGSTGIDAGSDSPADAATVPDEEVDAGSDSDLDAGSSDAVPVGGCECGSVSVGALLLPALGMLRRRRRIGSS